ncbi:MAG TPA: rhomboid family intramembrane serine protease [Steroidobacteraceae bacterium]|nr:rhomboid family intramembrane serine protease [Steroidobacteraceae bacterium]
MDADSDWIEVFRSPSPRDCDERALVLLAVGVPALMSAEHGSFALLVAAPDRPRALAELARYALENRPRPRALPPRLHPGGAAAAAGYALVLFAVAVAGSRGWLGQDWFAAGVLDGARLRSGELWRAVTALTLHADLAHLASNVGFGALFGGLAARVYGAGCGWLLILAAAVAANLVNGLTMPAGRSSLGASTAVFAALGALAVHRWPAATRRTRVGFAGASVVAALVLLALLGTGDAHTDVAAHALGFGFGAAFALPLRRWPPPFARRPQRLAAALALAVPAAGWALAYWM